MKKLSVFAFFVLFSALLFAQIKVVSPVNGKWANKQMLIIDASADGDYFYSIDGSDPEVVGFAYDEPILLDVTGDINLKIAHIFKDGRREKTQINFSVESNNGEGKTYKDFISEFFNTGLINYSAGSVLSIPKELQFCFDNSTDTFLEGTDLSLSPDCIVSRFVPCTVFDKKNNQKWRFFIHSFPQSAGVYSIRSVPFKVENWDTVYFTDENLLYKIDSDYWELPKEPKTLDRTVSHMISWQSLSFEKGNPVECFILPPVPEISQDVLEDGSVLFSLSDDTSYSMAIITDTERTELFSKIGIDTFFGEKLAGNIKIGFYANTVYQGEKEFSFDINKCPPQKPVFESNLEFIINSNNGSSSGIGAAGEKQIYYTENISRKDVHIDLINTDDCELYYKVIKGKNFDYNLEDFILAEDNKVSFDFENKTKETEYFRILAYSKNSLSRSDIQEIAFAIDQYNFYVNPLSIEDGENGTEKYPFKSFEKCLSVINQSREVTVHLNGKIAVPEGKHYITTNCTVIAENDCELDFLNGSSIVVQNSLLDLSSLRIKKSGETKSKKVLPVLKAENSVLVINDSQINASLGQNGCVIDLSNSVLNINNCIGVANSASYCSFISGVNSKINVKNSTLNSTSNTCVIISATDSETVVKNSSMQVFGKTGRIAEIFNGRALFDKNVFKLNISKQNTVLSVFFNDNAKVILANNEEYGM